MSKTEIRKLDLKNIGGIKGLINYKKIKNSNKKNNKNPKNLFRESKIKSIENNKNDEDKNNFNKTFNNKPMFKRKKTKEVSFKLNNIVDEIKKVDDNDNDNENKNEVKKLIRNFSSFSKESTMYRTKKKFPSSTQLKNNIKANITYDDKYKNNNNINNRIKRSKEPKIVRSFSANNLFNKDNNINNNNIFSGSQFITALNPLLNQRNSAKIITDNNKSSKSFFFNKIKSEKKFLTYFDIKKIYFLDKKVYKPNKEFERQVNKLKRNNSTQFIMNFNLDNYKMKVLNLFQKHICHQNFDIMKKNFDLITKAWKWKDNLKCHVRKKPVSSTQTEREIKYNQHKIDRENRIKNRNINSNKENNNENNLENNNKKI